MSWFKKNIAPKPQWWQRYTFSSLSFTNEDKIFLSSYTEESFNKILGDEYFINSRYKIHLDEYLKAVYHFINTGEKKYFYAHRQDDQDIRKQNDALRILVDELLKEKRP